MTHISAWQHAPQASEFLSTRCGLTDTDVIRARRMMGLLLCDWSLDRHDDCDGAVSLIICAAGDRPDAPTFALHLEAGMIQCGVVVDDNYRVIGRHDRVEAAIRGIAEFLRGDRPLAA